ncbi:SLIDE domain-containing protein [Leucosporidium creatinivorum]|uniref:SLIDE domain-containing protein n=1 Tax=Leucosporidium creatinivorum TaxID=106004 RepID=A0A1Y2G0H6_9BASI|nr:SLIDE domain-containing protein [Leucosporidium creatinivorum]
MREARHIKKIEDAEAGRQRNQRLSALVKKKVASVSYPLQQIKITYANQTKGKSYTDEEDRFLLCELAKYGVGKEDTPDKIKADINASPLFLFNWFAKSRVRLTSRGY